MWFDDNNLCLVLVYFSKVGGLMWFRHLLGQQSSEYAIEWTCMCVCSIVPKQRHAILYNHVLVRIVSNPCTRDFHVKI